ncbi:WbqC-like protein family protein [Legionella quinlivanii]|uniref:WbqC-like protein family protein n=1 Tax=Legionella quinlivanii TaxID=45073 RepID=A0A0W0Y617_9GAMM|nr:WbqC family protein [Legionella quinlivanii]KTD51955.1 WbqC-like protein family protein [Legionella quinlivanii]SEF85774.1 WbqC-like protein family protein [Legionella quinlivanii DSM 21216]STY09582.1 WbqC-like protein family [Legionella quinlivanii]
MNQKKIAILQSNYIPWKGYFDLISSVDEFILYDDMQYTRRDWRNRNRIKTANGILWLSIPVQVKGKYFQSIRDTKVSTSDWNKKHWQTIVHSYSKAPYFADYKEFFENLYLSTTEEYLSEINTKFIIAINKLLNIKTPIRSSSEFDLAEGKSERLLELCKKLNATTYLSGPAARDYLDQALFANEKIDIEWMDYSGYSEYKQLFPPFDHAVSIIDLLFNCGPHAPGFMKQAIQNEPSLLG